MTVLVVDWLGRGGITQYAYEWATTLDGLLITRAGREATGSRVIGVPVRGRGLVAHVQLVGEVKRVIAEVEPTVVIVHNHLVPVLESRVHDAARDAGARLVFVVHDHRFHTRRAGLTSGLERLVDRADAVVGHSSFVADRIPGGEHREVVTVEHPALRWLTADRSGPSMIDGLDRPIALHFGVVRRRYKGGDIMVELARRTESWSMAVVGVGARRAQGVHAVDTFLEPAALTATVLDADAVVLPYRFATQSGAVNLSQCLGRVPVASAVGGIPEQIEDGESGILVEPAATADAWTAALDRLLDANDRTRIGDGARAASERRHERFEAQVRALTSV